MEERHASPDGVVEAPVLAHVRPEHPKSVPPFHGAQHLPRLAWHTESDITHPCSKGRWQAHAVQRVPVSLAVAWTR
jgi:hypothetical protein